MNSRLRTAEGRRRATLQTLVVGLALLGQACGALADPSTGGTSPVPSPVTRADSAITRVIRTFEYKEPWRAQCDLAGCASVPIAWADVRTPPSLDSVGVVVTVTLDYLVEGPDYAEVELVYTAGGAPGPRLTLPPGRFPLTSPQGSVVNTTTSMHWGRRRIAGAGEEYSFQAEVIARDMDGDGGSSVSGSLITLVVELWTVGG